MEGTISKLFVKFSKNGQELDREEFKEFLIKTQRKIIPVDPDLLVAKLDSNIDSKHGCITLSDYVAYYKQTRIDDSITYGACDEYIYNMECIKQQVNGMILPEEIANIELNMEEEENTVLEWLAYMGNLVERELDIMEFKIKFNLNQVDVALVEQQIGLAMRFLVNKCTCLDRSLCDGREMTLLKLLGEKIQMVRLKLVELKAIRVSLNVKSEVDFDQIAHRLLLLKAEFRNMEMVFPIPRLIAHDVVEKGNIPVGKLTVWSVNEYEHKPLLDARQNSKKTESISMIGNDILFQYMRYGCTPPCTISAIVQAYKMVHAKVQRVTEIQHVVAQTISDSMTMKSFFTSRFYQYYLYHSTTTSLYKKRKLADDKLARALIDEFLQSDALNSCAYGVIQFSILNTGRLKVPVRCSRSNEIVGFISCKVELPELKECCILIHLYNCYLIQTSIVCPNQAFVRVSISSGQTVPSAKSTLHDCQNSKVNIYSWNSTCIKILDLDPLWQSPTIFIELVDASGNPMNVWKHPHIPIEIKELFYPRKSIERIGDILASNNALVSAHFGRQQTTALHEAARKGDIKLAQLLLSRGSNIMLRNSRGQIPKDLACNDQMRTLLSAPVELKTPAWVKIHWLVDAYAKRYVAWMYDMRNHKVAVSALIQDKDELQKLIDTKHAQFALYKSTKNKHKYVKPIEFQESKVLCAPLDSTLLWTENWIPINNLGIVFDSQGITCIDCLDSKSKNLYNTLKQKQVLLALQTEREAGSARCIQQWFRLIHDRKKALTSMTPKVSPTIYRKKKKGLRHGIRKIFKQQ